MVEHRNESKRVALRYAMRARGNGGQAAVEYLLALALLSIVLFVGDPSPLEQLMAAIRDRYARFGYALSLP